MILHKTPFFIPLIFPKMVWKIKESEKVIYLTFDDGPIPEVTEFVLETLDKYKAKATFFCVGDNIAKYPEIFQKIIVANHSIGNHTYNHLKGWNTPNEAYLNNVALCENLIGNESKMLFRPPYGRIKNSQIKLLSQKYTIIMWDVLSADYEKIISKESCLKNTIKATDKGSIVLFHDHYKTYEKIKYVLPAYLEYFTEKGFIFKSLS